MELNTKYGLLKSDIEHLISILKTNNKVSEIILFGSRAKGNFSNGSDIDLAIKGNNLNLNDITTALLEIDNLYLPNKVDLIIYNHIKETALINHIDRVGIVLFEKE